MHVVDNKDQRNPVELMAEQVKACGQTSGIFIGYDKDGLMTVFTTGLSDPEIVYAMKQVERDLIEEGFICE